MKDLSNKEREVMALVITGATSKEIASELGLSPRTIEAHAERSTAKLGARNRLHAAVMFDRAQRVGQ